MTPRASTAAVAAGTVAVGIAPSLVAELSPQLAAAIEQTGQGALVAVLVVLVIQVAGLRAAISGLAAGLTAASRRDDAHEARLSALEQTGSGRSARRGRARKRRR